MLLMKGLAQVGLVDIIYKPKSKLSSSIYTKCMQKISWSQAIIELVLELGTCPLKLDSSLSLAMLSSTQFTNALKSIPHPFSNYLKFLVIWSTIAYPPGFAPKVMCFNSAPDSPSAHVCGFHARAQEIALVGYILWENPNPEKEKTICLIISTVLAAKQWTGNNL